MPNRYQNYLNDRREELYRERQADKRHQSAVQTGKVIATVGGIAAAVGLYKRGTFDPLIKRAAGALGLDELLMKGRQALAYNTAYRTSVRKLTDGDMTKWLSPDYDAFSTILDKQLSIANQRLADPLTRTLSGLQKDTRNMYTILEGAKNNAVRDKITNNALDEIVNDPNVPDEIKRHLVGKIRGNKEGTHFVMSADSGNIFDLLDREKAKHGFSGDLGPISKSIEDALKKSRKEFTNIANGADINKQMDYLRDTMIRQIHDRYGSGYKGKKSFMEGFLSKAGYTRATAQDLMDFNGGGADSVGSRFAQFVQDSAKLNLDATKLSLGDELFMGGRGNIFDARYITKGTRNFMDTLATNYQIPFVNLNPLRLTQTVMMNASKNAPNFNVYEKGSVALGLNKAGRAQEDIIQIYDRLYNMSGELISNDSFNKFSSAHGSVSRMAADIMGVGQKSGNWFQEFLDIGLQRNESQLGRKASTVTKFGNPNWVPNILKRVKDGRFGSYDDAESLYRQLTSYLTRNTKTLGSAEAKDLYGVVTKSINDMGGGLDLSLDDIAMDTPEEVMETFEKMMKSGFYKRPSGSKRHLFQQLQREWSAYEKNPEQWMYSVFTQTSPEFAMPGMFETLAPNMTEIMPKTDQIKRLIQQELIDLTNVPGTGNLAGFVAAARFSPNGQQTFREMQMLNELLVGIDAVSGVKSVGGGLSNAAREREAILDQFINSIQSGDEFGQSLDKIISKRYPKWGLGPGEEIPNPFEGQSYIPVKRAKSPFKEMLAEINRAITNKSMPDMQDIWTPAKNFMNGLFAGRKNLEDVNSSTFFPYYGLHRLNDLLGSVGLGLSSKSMGSAGSIYFNMMAKRYGAAILGLEALKYLDYEIEKDTGWSPSKGLGDAYANMTLDAARLKDSLGITAWSRSTKGLFPGAEHLFQNPLGGAVKFLTGGFIGDTRSEEELKKYYASGRDPVRRGRWWSWGSNTAYYGGQIDYYTPNWYRKLQSDYLYTDVMYGSKDEYWANSFLPTPRYPLAPLRHFLFDQNHWAKKHEVDRPYPVSGGVAEISGLPLIGPIWDSTAGRILTPKTTRSTLAQDRFNYIRDYNIELAAQYENAGNGFYVTGSGQTSIVNVQPSEPGLRYPINKPGAPITEGVAIMGDASDYTGDASSQPIPNGPAGLFARAQQNSQRNLDAYRASKQGANKTYKDAVGVGTAMGGVASKQQLANINRKIIARSSIGEVQRISKSDLRDVGNSAELRAAVDPNSIGANLRESYYSASEILGMYGFASGLMLGQPDWFEPTLAESSDMTSYSRWFWNMNLGGAGGDLSELTRRVFTRDRQKNKYNPIRNSMPDWMPFEFRYGDPYVANNMKEGEARLPGSGYEALNKLHPDMFGRYGAIDRFKILADIAPYSPQFRYYQKVMAIYNQSGILTEDEKEDIADIKEEVGEKKEKYDISPYRFKYAKVIKKKVRITQMLDATTFMADGIPNPIRLAAVKMPAQSDTSEGAMMAREYLGQRIAAGMDVTIGIDADPLSRVRDDTYHTMRAVVWSGGENVNRTLSRMEYGGMPVVKTKWDDASSSGTYALYEGGERFIGRIWETIAHLDTPINTKFLQEQSPVESYKRRQVYGKDFRTWEHPIESYVTPLIDTLGQGNPLISTAIGAGIGSLFGVKGKGKGTAALIGAGIVGTASVMRVLRESAPGDIAPIPKRREEQRNIEEYFDILKYVKYKRLYDRARVMAVQTEGVDVEQFSQDVAGSKGLINKKMKKGLEARKRYLNEELLDSRADEENIKMQIKKINAKLNALSGQREIYKIGKMSQLALQYKGTYENTLYGAPDNAQIAELFAALPKNDREYLNYFLNAYPEEREEILRIIPKNERRFLQSKWGLTPDKKEDLGKYFESHYLPGPNWEGWKPDVSLESVKIKVLKQEGLDASDFGFYPQDVESSMGAPTIRDYKRRNTFNPAMAAKFPDILTSILDGFGVTDIQIKSQIMPMFVGKGPVANVKAELKRDRSSDYAEIMNDNYNTLVG